MAINRYYNRKVRANSSRIYQGFLSSRGLHNGVSQYTTPTLYYPTADQIAELTTKTHVWASHDKFYKVAHKYYGEQGLWWVVAWFNQTPTEAHVDIGDVIYIPFPLESVYSFFGV